MDILSHSLWTYAVYKAANKSLREQQNKRPFKIWLAAFWGIFPDLFAFIIPFLWIIWHLVARNFSFSEIPQPFNGEPPPPDTIWVFRLTYYLYSISHSLVIFAVVFAVLFFILRIRAWEIGGWPFHIILDVFSHSYHLFPTPILWPLSSWKFKYGVSWAEPQFMLINYSFLILTLLILRKRRRRQAT